MSRTACCWTGDRRRLSQMKRGAGRETPCQPPGIEIGEDGGQLPGHALGLEQLARLHVESIRQDVGGEDPPLAVGDLGPAGDQHFPPLVMDSLLLCLKRNRRHPDTDQGEGRHEGDDENDDPPLRQLEQAVAPLDQESAAVMAGQGRAISATAEEGKR